MKKVPSFCRIERISVDSVYIPGRRSVVPGTAFGSLGEGYVRFALVYPVEVIEEAVKAIDDSGILK